MSGGKRPGLVDGPHQVVCDPGFDALHPAHLIHKNVFGHEEKT